MARKLRVHFSVPADRVPAPHHQSGSETTPVGQLGNGRGNVAACDPNIVFDEWDNATGEWYAVQCAACAATAIHKAARQATPDPRKQKRPDAVDPEDAGCCG